MSKYKLKFIGMIVVIFALSFIPENFSEFFGDYHCNGYRHDTKTGLYSGNCPISARVGVHNPSIHWGFRHWLWMFSGLVLFIWNAVEILESYRKDTQQ